jgi:hypothetical protein
MGEQVVLVDVGDGSARRDRAAEEKKAIRQTLPAWLSTSTLGVSEEGMEQATRDAHAAAVARVAATFDGEGTQADKETVAYVESYAASLSSAGAVTQSDTQSLAVTTPSLGNTQTSPSTVTSASAPVTTSAKMAVDDDDDDDVAWDAVPAVATVAATSAGADEVTHAPQDDKKEATTEIDNGSEDDNDDSDSVDILDF